MKLLHDAVDAEGALTRPRARRAPRVAPASRLGVEFKVHLWLLATLDGELCLGPDRGGSHVPRADRRLARRARAAPARRLAGRARAPLPARLRARRRARSGPLGRAAAARHAARVRADRGRAASPSGELFTLGRPPRAARSPVVRMLGAFDNYNLGYVDRGHAVAPEHEQRIVPGGGIVRPAITVDGRLRRHLVLEARRRAARGHDRAVRAARPGDRGGDRSGGRRHRPLRGADATWRVVATIPRR